MEGFRLGSMVSDLQHAASMEPPNGLGKEGEEQQTVLIAEEDVVAIDAAVVGVPDGAGMLGSKRSSHAPRLPREGGKRKTGREKPQIRAQTTSEWNIFDRALACAPTARRMLGRRTGSG